ncbi:hypothetical protein [Marinobacter sp.]|uniref:hypothetical protein n=1 Tax=Marinobacter sp. TaxID=50741 RepID=UPI002B26683D|nr:hypothetical protein [Marinobacter sp.]
MASSRPPTEKVCAIEIGKLCKADPDALPRALADVFMKHGVESSRCQNIGAMVMSLEIP